MAKNFIESKGPSTRPPAVALILHYFIDEPVHFVMVKIRGTNDPCPMSRKADFRAESARCAASDWEMVP